MKKIVLLMLTCLLASCTYNVSMAHTQGTATDTIDDTMSNRPDVSPEISVPVPGGV